MKNKNTWHFNIDNFPAGKTTWPCRISIPVCPNFKIPAFSVIRPNGSVVPAQSRTIIKYPSGSPRWIQLDFTGSGLYKITNKSCVYKNQNFLSIEKIENGFIVKNNRLKIVLNKKISFPIQSIIWKDLLLACPDAIPYPQIPPLL